MRAVVIKMIRIFAISIYPFWIIKERYFPFFQSKVRAFLIQQKLKNYKCKVGDNLSVGKRVDFKIGHASELSIGNNVKIGDDVYIKVKDGAKLFIGNDVHINKATRVSSNKEIIIGDNSLIAPYCNILDHNHVFDLTTPVSVHNFDCASIIIGKGVWLGVKVQVNKGVNIGDFCVIGANSVVTKNVPSSSVFGGIPAKKIK